jgi:hypothetical protein
MKNDGLHIGMSGPMVSSRSEALAAAQRAMNALAPSDGVVSR